MKKLALLCGLIVGAMSFAACAGNDAENQVPAPYRVNPASTDHACALGAAAYAQVELTNAGLFDQKQLDRDKTEVLLLAKKPIHKDMWESIYFVTLRQHDGKSISLVMVSTNTADECSVEAVKTYVVSHQFGDLPEQADLLKSLGNHSGK